MKKKQPKHAKIVLAKLILTLLLLTYSTAFLKAETSKSTSVDSTWTLDTTVGDVKCYYKIGKCGDVDVAFALFENTSKTNVTISWDEEITSNRKSIQANPNGNQTLTISPGITYAVNCDDTQNSALYVLAYQVDDGNTVNIYKFHFINCKIK